MDDARSRPATDIDAGMIFNAERELIELRSEITQLERRLRAQHLGGLAAYVLALKQRVEECLSGARREHEPRRALLPAVEAS